MNEPTIEELELESERQNCHYTELFLRMREKEVELYAKQSELDALAALVRRAEIALLKARAAYLRKKIDAKVKP